MRISDDKKIDELTIVDFIDLMIETLESSKKIIPPNDKLMTTHGLALVARLSLTSLAGLVKIGGLDEPKFVGAVTAVATSLWRTMPK